MKLKDILLQFNPSKELKAKLQNNQIKVNNVIIKDLNIDIEVSEYFLELSEFVYFNIESLKGMEYLGDIENFIGYNDTNIQRFQFLSSYILISLSKKEKYVFLPL